MKMDHAKKPTFEVLLSQASLCVDEILNDFMGEPPMSVARSPELSIRPSEDNVEAAALAVDNILGGFEIGGGLVDLGASGEGSVGDIENKVSLGGARGGRATILPIYANS